MLHLVFSISHLPGVLTRTAVSKLWTCLKMRQFSWTLIFLKKCSETLNRDTRNLSNDSLGTQSHEKQFNLSAVLRRSGSPLGNGRVTYHKKAHDGSTE